MKRIVFLILGVASLFSSETIASYLKDYSEEERGAIQKDLEVARSVCFKEGVGENPIYLAAAGSRGVKETELLERFVRNYLPWSQVIYLDPDHRTLKFIAHTHYNQYLWGLNSGHLYEKWHAAANYITLMLLEEAFAKKRDVVHGTALIDDDAPNFLSKVKEGGYEIVLLLRSSEECFRERATQCMNIYFAHADTLYLFWSDGSSDQERLGALLTRGKLQIVDYSAFDHWIKKFEKDRALLVQEGKQILSWGELLHLYRSRF